MNRADWHAYQPCPVCGKSLDGHSEGRLAEYLPAAAIIVAFLAVFVIPTLLGWHG